MLTDEAAVRAALATVVEPDVGLPVTELGMVRGIVVGDDLVRVSLARLAPSSPWGDRLRDEATAAVRTLGVRRVDVDVVTLDDDARGRLRERLQGARPASPTAVFTGCRVIAISSGKGGVGKSSVSVNLAVALARRGKRVALIDADVYGFSVPRMIGVDRKPLILDTLVVPPRVHGVDVVSVALFAEHEETPIIWRGPMLHKMLSQFLIDVWWREPEFLLVDMPPGTGDVALTMAQLLPSSEVVVVTTPQQAAQKVAQRAAYMARKVDLPVTGVIENMSWFTGDDGRRYELFGVGGGDLLAQQLGVPLLGQVPFLPALREGCDNGQPVTAVAPDSEAAAAVHRVVDALLAHRPRRATLPVITVRSAGSG